MNNKYKSNTILTVFVIVFAAFLVAGLAIVPSLQEATANELNLLKNGKDKKPKKNDFTLEEPIIELVKNDKLKKDKGPKDKG